MMAPYVFRQIAVLAFTAVLMAGGFASAEAATALQQGLKSCPVYSVEGEGEEHVILLPGLNSSPAVWDDFARRSKSRYRLHRFTVPGFAGAPAEPRYQDKPADALAADLLHYISCNQLEQVTLIGHSFGGFAALKTALSWNTAIKQLVIVDAMPFYPLVFDPAATPENTSSAAKGFIAMINNQSDEEFAASQTQAMRALVQGSEDQAKLVQWSIDSDRATMAAAVDQLMREDLRPRLAEITIPVAVIFATNPYAPRERMQPLYDQAYSGLPDVVAIETTGSYHFIMLDRPAAFASTIEYILAKFP